MRQNRGAPDTNVPGATALSPSAAGRPRGVLGTLSAAARMWLRVRARLFSVWLDAERSRLAIWMTMLSNVREMNVMTCGSLFARLSHHRNGLSTQPPSNWFGGLRLPS